MRNRERRTQQCCEWWSQRMRTDDTQSHITSSHKGQLIEKLSLLPSQTKFLGLLARKAREPDLDVTTRCMIRAGAHRAGSVQEPHQNAGWPLASTVGMSACALAPDRSRFPIISPLPPLFRGRFGRRKTNERGKARGPRQHILWASLGLRCPRASLLPPRA